MEFPLYFSFVKKYVKGKMQFAKTVDFIPGFKFFYGNINAKNVFLSDTFFLDYVPIYIGEGSKFSFDNIVITSTHDRKNFDTVVASPVYIGKNVWITSRCIILPGVRIGDNSIIGAGSVVTKNIPANCFAAGNPAKVIKYFKD